MHSGDKGEEGKEKDSLMTKRIFWEKKGLWGRGKKEISGDTVEVEAKGKRSKRGRHIDTKERESKGNIGKS